MKDDVKVKEYIELMFGNLRNSPGYIDSILEAPLSVLDLDLLWSTFYSVTAKEILFRSEGDLAFFNDFAQSAMLQTAICAQWPQQYYLEKLVSEGIVYKFEDGDNVTYAVKETYRPILNTILIEVDSNQGS